MILKIYYADQIKSFQKEADVLKSLAVNKLYPKQAVWDNDVSYDIEGDIIGFPKVKSFAETKD